jgi:chromosome segregation ATPase
MGRKAKHTQEQVFEVADQIAASGQEVTPTVLLAALGGSLTTIYRHLEAWQALRKDAPAPVVFEMPDDVKAAFSRAWQAAATEAAKEIAAIREKADSDVKTITRRLDEAVANIAQLESEADTDATRIEALETELATENAAAIEAATAAAKRESSLAATVEQMQYQINAQQAELTRIHAEHEAARKQQAEALKNANDEASRLRAKLDEEAAKTERANERERKMLKDLTTAQADVARLTEQLKDQKQRSIEVIAKLEDSKHKMEGQLHVARTEALECATQLGTVTGQCEALRAQVATQGLLIKDFANRSGSARS